MRKAKVDIAPLLLELQSLDWKVRSEAAQALGKARDPAAVEPLIEILRNDRSWTARSRAAVALGRLQDQRAIEPLILAMQAGNWQLSQHSFKAIVKFGEKAVPAINASIDSEGISSYVRARLVDVLRTIGAPATLSPLLHQSQSPDLDVRVQAICALGELRDNRAIEPLIQILQDPGPLPALTLPDAVPSELQAMYDPTPMIRQAAATALGNFDERRVVEPLVHVFHGDDPFGREQELFLAATNALRRIGGVRARDYRDLQKLIQREEATTRIAAALSLAWLRDARGVAVLESATQDEDALVRYAAEWALRSLKTVLGYNIPVLPMMVDYMLR